jgi:hypothetical protein
MKSVLITTLFAFAALGLQAAKDDKLPAIPKEKEGRWGIYSYTEAKEEAAKKKRPIGFVVSDERAEEASEKEAALKAYWGVAKDCTMLVVPSRILAEAKNRLGDTVYAAITSAAVGKPLPRLIVMNTTADKVLGHMSKDAIMAADEKAMKAFSKQMEDYNKDPSKVPATAAAAPAAPAPAAPAATPAAPAPAATPPAATGPVVIKDAKPENWTSAQGRTVQATLVEVSGDSATLLMADGRKVPVPVASLSAESQKRIEELKAASSK